MRERIRYITYLTILIFILALSGTVYADQGIPAMRPAEPGMEEAAVLQPLIIPELEEGWEIAPITATRTLDALDFERFMKSLEADRKLLVELRKDLPQAREEADIYLHQLKLLSTQSDPVRLVPLMNRVLTYSPLYFKWLATEFESQEDQIIEYYIGGARSFNFALEKFRSAAMFTIINRIEIASRALRELNYLAYLDE